MENYKFICTVCGINDININKIYMKKIIENNNRILNNNEKIKECVKKIHYLKHDDRHSIGFDINIVNKNDKIFKINFFRIFKEKITNIN